MHACGHGRLVFWVGDTLVHVFAVEDAHDFVVEEVELDAFEVEVCG